jgi:hypothetical protein
MAIDGCARTFRELATEVLPNHMQAMHGAMQKPIDIKMLCEPWSGTRLMIERFGDVKSGCYVLMREGKAFYVGISRRVLKRLKHHVGGTGHNDASLAYRMAKEKVNHKLTRDGAMEDVDFRKAFQEAKQLLNGCNAIDGSGLRNRRSV